LSSDWKNSSGDRDLFGACLSCGTVLVSRRLVQDIFRLDSLSFVSIVLLATSSFSPCGEPTDMKFIPVLKSKPSEMTEEMWDMLCSYEFGTIIFGLPNCSNDTPVPVSNDLYVYLLLAQLITTTESDIFFSTEHDCR
jgi:hypothetical protein